VRGGVGEGQGPSVSVRPGALTALLEQLAAAPEAPAEAPELPSLQPGQVIGRFELVRELGRGGFGVVWEALDRDLRRKVAFKLVRPRKAGAGTEQLQREAEVVARLSHQNLVTLHDVGRCEQGAYLILELLRGETLQLRLDRGPVPLEEAMAIAKDVARGLAHAHAEGVVHRDLKPSNVFLTERGGAKIVDFGLAHAFGRRRVSGGTPAYMAPEQWNEDPEDERTDVFALGVMLHRMLSGEEPYSEDGGRWSSGSAEAPGLDVPGAPALGPLVGRMLEKAPHMRPRDGAEVLAALEAIPVAPPAAKVTAHPGHTTRRRGGFTRPRSRLVALLAGAGILVALTGVGWYASRGSHPQAASEAARPSIAVLPFDDLSPGHDQEHFSDGIAGEILNGLARVEGLKVPGRASSFWFKGKRADPPEIARKLGVTHLLEGSVRHAGGRLRIDAEVVRAADGSRLWAQTFDREQADVFAIQDEIAGAVVAALRVKLLPSQVPVATEYRPASQEAYQSYLLGTRFTQSLSNASQKRAAVALERAVALEPAWPQAWAALAQGRLVMGMLGLVDWDEARRGSSAAAGRAVELAPDLAEALAARAHARLYEWDWAGAKADLDRALQRAPEDVQAVGTMAFYFLSVGRPAEAVNWAQRFVEKDPLSGYAWNRLGVVLSDSGRFEDARQAYLRALEADPQSDFIPVNLGYALIAAGRAPEALACCEPLGQGGLTCMALAHHALGQAADAQRALDELQRIPSANALVPIARVHAQRGDAERAFELLDRARVAHVRLINNVAGDAFFRPLHRDPRWKAFLRKLGLPPD
jgi:TolB-like protein/tetratricopeptide (TPR) repeat protein